MIHDCKTRLTYTNFLFPPFIHREKHPLTYKSVYFTGLPLKGRQFEYQGGRAQGVKRGSSVSPHTSFRMLWVEIGSCNVWVAAPMISVIGPPRNTTDESGPPTRNFADGPSPRQGKQNQSVLFRATKISKKELVWSKFLHTDTHTVIKL